jgi:hypothetical protein
MIQRTRTIINFPPATFLGRDYRRFVQLGVGFDVHDLETNVFFRGGITSRSDFDKAFALAEEYDDLDMTFSGINREDFSIVNNNEQQAIHWTVLGLLDFESELFRLFINHPNFISAYSTDDLYESIQSERYPGNFGVYGRKYDGELYYDDFWQSHMIDITVNPGRMRGLPKMWIGATWRSWHSAQSLNMFGVSEEHVMAFPYGRKLEKDPNANVIMVELYEDPFESEDPENQKIQRQFRDWMKMDELELRYPDH